MITMEQFNLGFGGEQTQKIVCSMAAKNVAGPGTPGRAIEYLDFSDQHDNSSYVPELQNRMLQPVEVFDEDLFLSQINLEKLV